MEKVMSRPASGDEAVLTKARAAIANARTVEQLRQAQAVVLPLDYGLSLHDTALVIGVSRGWACQLRRRFMQGKTAGSPDATARGGRHHQNMTPKGEREFLAPFLTEETAGHRLVISEIKAALEAHLDRKVALASVYNLLHRHGWRKPAANDCKRPLFNAAAQNGQKKAPQQASPKPPKPAKPDTKKS
jgi:transposase